MAEHYTRSSISVTAYCNKCQRTTQHRIADRRKGPCLECIAKLGNGPIHPKSKPDQGSLFDQPGPKLFLKDPG